MTVTDATTEAPVASTRPKPKKSIWQLEITPKKVSRKDLMHFSRQLAVFIRAGIPILDALDSISEEMGNKFFKGILDDISEELRGGSTFANAADRHHQAFPAFYLGILRSAELTGRLDDSLEQLAEYIERDLEARRKITSALIYPAIIAVMAVIVVGILVGYVLPKFKDFFTELDAELPLPTRMLLAVTDFTTGYWWIFLVLVGLFIAVGVWMMRFDRGRTVRDILLLKLPALGDLVQHIILERFCRILASMVAAGVPLPDALRVTGDATSNVVYQRGIGEAREAMIRGEGLAQPLTDTGLFPAAARQMFRVGEDTGTLDQQLDTAAGFFERELDYKIKRFTSLFEPLVIVGMGLIVGFVAIALVSAMYGIFRQVDL